MQRLISFSLGNIFLGALTALVLAFSVLLIVGKFRRGGGYSLTPIIIIVALLYAAAAAYQMTLFYGAGDLIGRAGNVGDGARLLLGLIEENLGDVPLSDTVDSIYENFQSEVHTFRIHRILWVSGFTVLYVIGLILGMGSSSRRSYGRNDYTSDRYDYRSDNF